jgi:hypothetical protein
MFLGAIWRGNKLRHWLALRFALIGIAALVATPFAFDLGPRPTQQYSTFDLLVQWHNPTLFVSQLEPSLLRFVAGVNPTVLLLVGFGTLKAIAARRIDLLLMTVPVAVINLLFWIPNGERERHFLYMLPALALLVGSTFRNEPLAVGKQSFFALGTSAGLLILAAFTAKSSFLYLAAIPLAAPVLLAASSAGQTQLVAIAALVALSAGSIGVFWINGRLMRNPMGASAHGDFTNAFTALWRKIPDGESYVVTDAYPVVSLIQRQEPQADVSLVDAKWTEIPQQTHGWLRVRHKSGTTYFYVQGWNIDLAAKSLAERARGRPIQVLVDHRMGANAEERFRQQQNFAVSVF